MKRPRKLLSAALLFPAIGCGAMPDFILKELRDSAKEAFEQQVDQLVDDLMQGFLEDVELPIDMAGDEPTEE